MGLILVAVILLLISFSLKILFLFKIEQSLFISICIIVSLLFLFGILGQLIIGYYLILVVSPILFIISLIKIFFSKKNIKEFEVGEYITPGIVVFLLSSAIYYLSIRGEIMAITDAAVHWGYATKWMFETDVIYKGVQTLGVPIFNYFFIKTAGYSESYFFLGRWMIMWAAIILPISNIKWNKWYKVLLYASMVYMILGVIDPVPNMFMDLPLGVVAGAVCAMLAVMSNQKKVYFTSAFSVVLIGNIKNGSGLLFSVFVIGFAAIVYFNNKKSDSKPNIMYPSVFLLAFTFAELFRRFTHESNIKDNAEPGMVIPLNYQEIISRLTQKTTIALVIATLIVVAFLIFLKVKKKKDRINSTLLYKIVIAITCGLIIITMYKMYAGFFSALSYNDQIIFIKFWEKYAVKGYYGMQIRSILGVIIAFVVACCLLALKREHIKCFYSQTIYMVLSMFAFAFMLIVSYLSSFIEMEAAGYAAFHRYIGSSIVFVSMWITGYIVLSYGVWKEEKKQIVAAVILLAFLSRETPPLGSVYNFGLKGEAGIHKNIMQDSITIKNATQEDDRIYFIAQEYDKATYLSEWSVNAWIRYEIAPRYLNWVFWSLGDDFNDVDPSTLNIESSEFKNTLINGYDYVYLYSADDKFWELYGDLFSIETRNSESKLFKVNNQNEYILEAVGK